MIRYFVAFNGPLRNTIQNSCLKIALRRTNSDSKKTFIQLYFFFSIESRRSCIIVSGIWNCVHRTGATFSLARTFGFFVGMTRQLAMEE